MDKVEQVFFSVAIVLIDTIMYSNPKGHLPANTDKEHFVWNYYANSI